MSQIYFITYTPLYPVYGNFNITLMNNIYYYYKSIIYKYTLYVIC